MEQTSATLSIADRRKAGAALRAETPRSAHAAWSPAADRGDPVAILVAQGASRLQNLVPLRYFRMQGSAFAFLRGAAAVMAADLAATPRTGPVVQSCGDCHLANFGAFRSPEGAAMFDINDFDETLAAPFEWDLKRLGTSLMVAGADQGLPEKACLALVRSMVAAYRTHMSDLANLSPMEAWRSRIALDQAIQDIADPKLQSRAAAKLQTAMQASGNAYGLVQPGPDGATIRARPGLVTTLDDHELAARDVFQRYAETLAPERQVLFTRYALRDVAFKVVGVGSVGTFCAIGLFTTADGAPLVLQLKQAEQSVLAPFAGPSPFAHQGERVVVGQRIMQAAADIFLGWTAEAAPGSRQFYVRELKDQRLATIATGFAEALAFHAPLCGRTLARAHARSGDAATLAGYLGNGETFDDAIASFAQTYAAQNRADWQALQAAIASGRIAAADIA